MRISHDRTTTYPWLSSSLGGALAATTRWLGVPALICGLVACPDPQNPDGAGDAASDAGNADTAVDASSVDTEQGDATFADGGGADGDAAFAPVVWIGAPQANTFICGTTIDHAGNVYLAGFTNGSLAGVPLQSLQDLFLVKAGLDGTVKWIRTIGATNTGQGNSHSGCAVVTGSSSEAYVAGSVLRNGVSGATVSATQALVARFDSDGTLAWVNTFAQDTGNTEATALDLYAGQLQVLGQTKAGEGGQAAASENDVFLTTMTAQTGVLGRTLRFGDASNDLPLSLVRDTTGLWLGVRRLKPNGTPLGYELVHLDAQDQIERKLIGGPSPGFSVIDFQVTALGQVVLLGSVFSGDDAGYAFRAYQADGSLGDVVPGSIGTGMLIRDFVCGDTTCVVSGQRAQSPFTSTSGIEGFVHEYSGDWSLQNQTTIIGDRRGRYATAAAVASGPGCAWYAAGWSSGTFNGVPAVGTLDGFGLCTDGRGLVGPKP